MVNATVDNTAVSEQLTPGQSVTVPSGETWDVTIVATVYNDGFVTYTEVQKNGTNIITVSQDPSEGGPMDTVVTADVVLEDGDTISYTGNGNGTRSGCNISGYVV